MVSSVTIVLTLHSGGVVAALGSSTLVNDTDRLVVGVVFDNDLLAAVAKPSVVPLDRFEKPLKCSWFDILISSDRFGVLPLDVRE